MAEEQELKIVVTLDDQASASLTKLQGSMQQMGGTTAGIEKLGRATKETAGQAKALHGELTQVATKAGFIGGVIGGITLELGKMGVELIKRSTDLHGLAEETAHLAHAAHSMGTNAAQLQANIAIIKQSGIAGQEASRGLGVFYDKLGELARIDSGTFRDLAIGYGAGVNQIVEFTERLKRSTPEQALHETREYLRQERERITRETGSELAGAREEQRLAAFLGVPWLPSVKGDFAQVSAFQKKLHDDRAKATEGFLASTEATAYNMGRVVDSFAAIGAALTMPWMQRLEKLVEKMAELGEFGEAQFRGLPSWVQELIRRGLGAIPAPFNLAPNIGIIPKAETPGANTPQHFGGGGGMPFGFNIPEEGRSSIWDTSGGYSRNIEDRRGEVQTIGDNTKELQDLTTEVKRLNEILLFVEPGGGGGALGPMATRMGGLRGGLGGGIGYGGGGMGGAGPGGGGGGGGPGGGGPGGGPGGGGGGGGEVPSGPSTGGPSAVTSPTGGPGGGPGVTAAGATPYSPEGTRPATLPGSAASLGYGGGGAAGGGPGGGGGFQSVPDLMRASGAAPPAAGGAAPPAAGGAAAATAPFPAKGTEAERGGSLYQKLLAEFTANPPQGIPPDAARFGITKGTPEEWAKFGVSVANEESSFRPGTVGPKEDPGGSYGVFQYAHGQVPGGNAYDVDASVKAFARDAREASTRKAGIGSGGPNDSILSRRFAVIGKHPERAIRSLPYAGRIAAAQPPLPATPTAPPTTPAEAPPSAVTMLKTVPTTDGYQYPPGESRAAGKGLYQYPLGESKAAGKGRPGISAATAPDLAGFTGATPMMPAPETVAGQAVLGSGRGGLVEQAQSRVAATRKGAIDPRLDSALQYAAERAGVKVRVTSGGQRMEGAPGATGSHRHDQGKAADLDIVDPKTGKVLDRADPRRLMFLEAAARAGAGGTGAGYMDDPLKVHVGITGKESVVGQGLGPYAGNEAEQAAVNRGIEQSKTFDRSALAKKAAPPQNIKVLDAKRAEPDVDATLLDKASTRNVTVNGAGKIDVTVKPEGSSSKQSELYRKQDIPPQKQMEPTAPSAPESNQEE